MKKFATLVAAIVLIAGTSVANAADNMWFSVVSAPAGWTNTGGPGQALAINTGGQATGTVRLAINITSDTGALAGWSIALNSPQGSFANGAAQGSGYDQVLPGGPNGSNSWETGRGSATVAGSTGQIYQFDLVINGDTDVLGDFGALGIVKSNAFFWYGHVGANPISYAGGPGYTSGEDTTPGWGQIPVVHVTVPEPATLGLIGLGVVALIRRRK